MTKYSFVSENKWFIIGISCLIILLATFVITNIDQNVKERQNNFTELNNAQTCLQLAVVYGKVMQFEADFSTDEEEDQANEVLLKKMKELDCK